MFDLRGANLISVDPYAIQNCGSLSRHFSIVSIDNLCLMTILYE